MNKKCILVTGGAGYIGSHTVVELMKDREIDVVIVDNFSNSNPAILERIFNLIGREVKTYNRDCRENLDDIIQSHNIDGIIHFAAYKSVGESLGDPIGYYDNNINSLLNILKSAEKFGINKIVFSSSCSLYGNLKDLPATEDSPLSDPESPYAYTKLIGERILQDFSKSNPSFKIISLRYFNPVGAHESGLIGESPLNKPNNILPVICNSAESLEEMLIFGADYPTRDGTCIRDYVHVSDIADAHVLAITYLTGDDSKNYDVYNLGSLNHGSKKGISVLEIIKSFEEINQIKINYNVVGRRDGDIIEIYSDSSKAKEIGWEPKRTVIDMVSSAWKWHKNKI